MLNTDEIAEHLLKRTYMDGWRLTVYEGEWEGPHLVITARLPDAYNPGEWTLVDIHSMLPPIPNTDYLDRWVVWRLCRVATHEVREFYRGLDGKAIFDPHAPGADRDNPDWVPPDLPEGPPAPRKE